MKEEHVIWKLLEREEEEDKDINSPPEPCSEEEIRAAEEALGVTFHEGYKNYLQIYGGGYVGAYEIYGLRAKRLNFNLKDNLGDNPEEPWSVVYNTLSVRDQYWIYVPNEWYIVSGDGCGNPFGIDVQGHVWLSDHNTCELIRVAYSFEDFLYKLITHTLWSKGNDILYLPWPEEWFKKHRPDS